ncbi:hypothetical protein JCM6882_004737 [Rhodosporidiobolus microsporus]
MAAASPVSALPPSIHSSPRQQALSSKIPRRRPSTQLAAGPSPRAASSPVAGPSSPTKSALVGCGGHARKSSLTNRAHFDLNPTVFSSTGGGSSLGGDLASRLGSSSEGGVGDASPALQDRRRRTSSTTETREVSSARRTPSLSIYIPSAPSPAHHPSASSLRRPSHPSTSRPSPCSSAHPSSSSPSASFAPHSRRSSARTPRSSTHALPHPQPVVRPPMMERSWSNSTTTTTYTSFDLQHPRTPKEEREERELIRAREARARGWLRGWLGVVGLFAAGGEGDRPDEERQVGEREPLLASSAGAGAAGGVRSYGGGGEVQVARRDEQEGSGSGGWRYVAGETWCYAKHILPPLLVFVALVLVIALLAYRQAINRVAHPPDA